MLRFLALSLSVMSAVHETKGQEKTSLSGNSSICKLTPMDVGILLKKSGITFNRENLSVDYTERNLGSDFNMALSLGVLMTDFGYLIIYSNDSEVFDRLVDSRKLSGGLNVDKFFDFTTMKWLTVDKQFDSLQIEFGCHRTKK